MSATRLPGDLGLAKLATLPFFLMLAVLLATSEPVLAADGVGKADRLEVRKGDHVCIIGNTLADRMQHDGWLETFLQGRFPRHELVVRNLGFSGDELTLRLRSKDFGSPDEHLTRNKADVVLAFFGYNESFGYLGKFKADLGGFLKHTLAQKYNGQGTPRLVLFSPIAHEDLHDRSLPDGRENNRRLERITEVMAEQAREHHVAFVDLFHPTLELYPKAPGPLTINGIHLNERGNRQLAEVIDRSLFAGEPEPRRDPEALEALRRAVLDKNFTWFNRYRTVDGYSIYGGRADLRFVDGQTNREVAQREMEVLDVMTANRDRRIWAIAQGGDLTVSDDNTPPFIPVKTNKPGPGPNGEHIFLGGEKSIEKMTIGKGLRINLFASEEDFPDLINPVQLAFDTKGRLWVAVWSTYPHWKPKEEMNDQLLIFEDTDGDGKADKRIVFADHLHCPTGFEFARGGVLVAQQPDIMLLKDLDGDDRADTRERVLSGMDSADTHHAANSFRLDPGGALYFQEGTFHHTQVETPYGPPVRCANAGVYRYEPRSQKFEVYVSYGFANPHGHSFDRWGQDFVTDGTGAVNYFAAAFSGHVDFPAKHPAMKAIFAQRTRPCPGTEILSSRHFPEEFQGNYLVGNVIGFQGILRYKFRDDDSGFGADELEPIVSSTDENFRPTDLEMGPDGALYFTDWQNPVIGHMQHNLRDPSRDRIHGRIYRVTYAGRQLLKPARIAGEPVEKLLDLLKDPDDRVRYRDKIELGDRPTDEVIPALGKWVAALRKEDPELEHHRLEALWVHQYHDVVNEELLRSLLGSSDYRARAAATRVLCYWRDRVSDSLGLLKTLAADPHPRVRLEAVRAASYFTVPEAVEVPLVSLEHPSDYYLNYTRGETLKTLEPYWKKGLADGKSIDFKSDAAARFFLGKIGTDDLLKMKRTRGVCLEILFRKGVRDEDRRQALADLAKLGNQGQPKALVDALRGRDSVEADPGESVVLELVPLLAGRPATELTGVRGDIEQLATGANLEIIRQFGFAALIAADGRADQAWELANRSVPSLRTFLGAMPLIRDPEVRAGLYPKVQPLLHHLPASLESSKKGKGTYGRFVRVELPGRRTLTLAEVEVFSDGRNVARQGKATQKNTAFDAVASRGIDGNTSGAFWEGGQTHSEERTPDPWWEVDLGAELPIESIVIYNRTDGTNGKRLDGFALKILDAGRHVVFEKGQLPAPEPKTAIETGGAGAEGITRRAAMDALTYVRGQEVPTFKALAAFIREGMDRHAAILALRRIPVAYWPQEDARPLLESVIAYVRKVPTRERTSGEPLDAIQLGDALAALLPADQARSFRKELAELGVRVIRIGSVPDQMRFDLERIAVRAGKPVEILLENIDIMPHNLVVTQPGALEEVGLLAESTATQPGALERQYVPPSGKVLFASRLLQPRESQRLAFAAPSEPGVYPYVCTYPGHWRRMYGAMYVVEDLEGYLENPESYLAAHPLPIRDDLLKSTRPRKEWTFDDLASSVAELDKGRSFSNGKQVFQVATCISCHRMDGVGQEFGPDLSKLDPKRKPVDILKHVLEPSAEIEDKFATYLFETDSGQVVTGMVLEETPEVIKVIENPLAKAEPRLLKPSEVVARQKSPTSIMPKGLMDKLAREEILDLIAYIASRGDRDHPLVRGGEGHHHGADH